PVTRMRGAVSAVAVLGIRVALVKSVFAGTAPWPYISGQYGGLGVVRQSTESVTMKVNVVGTGYVGLVTGACLADSGHEVLCVDADEVKIERLREGHIPIYEPGLETIVATNAEAGRLRFSMSAEEAVAFGEIIVIAVGTPPDEDGSADLPHVLAAAKSIGGHTGGYRAVGD